MYFRTKFRRFISRSQAAVSQIILSDEEYLCELKRVLLMMETETEKNKNIFQRFYNILFNPRFDSVDLGGEDYTLFLRIAGVTISEELNTDSFYKIQHHNSEKLVSIAEKNFYNR